MSTIINTSPLPTPFSPSCSRVTDNSLSMPIATLNASAKHPAFAVSPRIPFPFLPGGISWSALRHHYKARHGYEVLTVFVASKPSTTATQRVSGRRGQALHWYVRDTGRHASICSPCIAI